MKLVSVRKLVQDFDSCFRFYRDIIGLEVKYVAEGGYYAAFINEGSDVLLELFTRQDAAEVIGADRPAETPAQYRTLVSFSVPDVDAAIEELRGKGADVASEPVDQPDWGVRIAYVRDPDGNLIELFTTLQNAQQ